MPDTTHTANSATIYRRLLSYVKHYWKIFLLAVCGMVLYSLMEGYFTKLMQPLLDEGFVAQDPEAIKWTPVLIVVAFFLRGVGQVISDYGMTIVARSVIRDLRKEMFTNMMELPISFYDRSSSGTIISKMVYDVEQLAAAASNVITTLIRDSLTIIVLLVSMIYMSPYLTFLLLVVLPLIAFLVQVVSKRFRKLSRRIQNSMGDVASITEEAVTANREVKIFGGQQYEKNRFENVNLFNRRQHLKIQLTNSLSSVIIQFIVVLAFAGIIHMALKPDFGMSAGEFTSFMLAMILMLQHARRLVGINVTLQQGIAAATSVFQFLDEKLENDSGKRKLETMQGKVEFRDVSFSYSIEKEPVLSGINLDIAAGQSVAFVGRSGAGKSTLVSLLPRFYESTEGDIRIDGVDVRDLSLASLRSHIALVSQNVTLFNDTVAHNIAYGALETADDDKIRQAARAAHALEFIEKLPDGMNTIVGEDGVLLSGGQRQRIAIARAILKDAPVLILDEATSALDTESERHIQSALETLMKNRTTLVIAHRLSTIEKVDKIVVLAQGKIVESGTHSELLTRNGHYAALHQLQFSG